MTPKPSQVVLMDEEMMSGSGAEHVESLRRSLQGTSTPPRESWVQSTFDTFGSICTSSSISSLDMRAAVSQKLRANVVALPLQALGSYSSSGKIEDCPSRNTPSPTEPQQHACRDVLELVRMVIRAWNSAMPLKE